MSKKYLPGMSCSLDHPKAHVHVGDGFEYMRNHRNEFDVIITDSSDPIGVFFNFILHMCHVAVGRGVYGLGSGDCKTLWVILFLGKVQVFVLCSQDSLQS